MKPLTPLNKKFNIKKAAYTALFFVTLILVWQVFAVTVFKTSGALPPPFKVLGRFFELFASLKFYRAVFSSFGRSLLSFIIAFIIGAALALISAKAEGAEYFIAPAITVLRSVPTLGITFILLMFFRGPVAAMIVAGLMTMPLTFSGFSGALKAKDKKLYEMAKVYKIKKSRVMTKIFLPASAPHISESVRAGLGLNLKVIIAAEIISIPRLSIGSGIHGAYTSGDFTLLFAWVVAAVLVCFLTEGAVKIISRKLMPWQSKDGTL